MLEFNLFRAPKPKVNNKGDSFLKQVLMIILSTTSSLSLTLGTISILDYNQKKKVRRMTAMMVMSNIETFARTHETRSERMARADSVGTWPLAQPIESFDTMPEDKLGDLINESINLQFLDHDHTAEKIFSNSIDT